MTRRFFAAFAVLVVTGFLAVAPALAQHPQLVVTLSQDFVVGEQVMPAGQYRIRRPLTNDARLFVIERTDASQAAMVVAVPHDSNEISKSTLLTFTRYGDELFLTGVAASGVRTSYRFTVSKRQEALAKAGLRGETVTLSLTASR